VPWVCAAAASFCRPVSAFPRGPACRVRAAPSAQLVSGALEELVLASATEYIRNRPDLRTDYYIGESCFGDGGFKLSSFGHDLSCSVIHPSD
jgi:hypothetical protein